MNLVQWWVTPHLSYRFNGGYAATLDRARDDARQLLRLQPGEHMSDYELHTRWVSVDNSRRDGLITALNKALEEGRGGHWS
jgi:hypothetical protein